MKEAQTRRLNDPDGLGGKPAETEQRLLKQKTPDPARTPRGRGALRSLDLVSVDCLPGLCAKACDRFTRTVGWALSLVAKAILKPVGEGDRNARPRRHRREKTRRRPPTPEAPPKPQPGDVKDRSTGFDDLRSPAWPRP